MSWKTSSGTTRATPGLYYDLGESQFSANERVATKDRMIAASFIARGKSKLWNLLFLILIIFLGKKCIQKKK